MALLKSSRNRGLFTALIFSLMCGSFFWDRLMISQISEVIMQALNISETKFSALTAVSTIAFALSSVFVGIISDKLGRRRAILVPFAILGGLVSLCCVFAKGYSSLLILRLFSGIFEGPALVLMMAIISECSAPGTFGRNAGIIVSGVAVLANTIGPIIVTRLITGFAWYTPFYITAFLQIFSGLLIIIFVDEVSQRPAETAADASLPPFHKNRNFIFCTLIGVCMMSGYWCTQLFAPIYMTTAMGMDTITRGNYASIMGFVYLVLQLIIPWFSDIVGRRRALAGAFALGIICPLSMWLLSGSMVSVWCYCIFGGFVATTSSLFGNVILMESLPASQKGAASGIVMGIAEVVGGTLWPIFVSSISDSVGGVSGIMRITSVLFVAAVVFSLLLKETNPKFIK